MFSWTHYIRYLRRHYYIVLLFGLAAMGVTGYIFRQSFRPAVFDIYVFGLKNAQAVLIRTPHDKRILINGGADSSIIRTLSTVLPFYSRRIDTVIVTDDTARNNTGLASVLGRYSVNQLILPGLNSADLGLASSSEPSYMELVNDAKAKNIVVGKFKEGDSYTLDGLSLNVLFPTASTTAFKYSKASSPQLVFEITASTTRGLFLGNATAKIQKYIRVEKMDYDIFSDSASGSSVANQLAGSSSPVYLVYSKRDQTPRPTKPSSKKIVKQLQDPWSMVPVGNRLNTQTKTVHFVVDGLELRVVNN